MAIVRLSYLELGARLGISTDAARVRARRHRWQVVKGNDGRAVVLVDETELPLNSPPERPGERPPEQTEHRPDTGPTIEELQAQLAYLKASSERVVERLFAATERAASAEGEVRALRDALGDLSRRLDVATAELTEARRPWWRRWS